MAHQAADGQKHSVAPMLFGLRVVVLGRQGSGKGTQGEQLSSPSQGRPAGQERVDERAQAHAVAENRLRFNVHDLPSGWPAAGGVHPELPGHY